MGTQSKRLKTSGLGLKQKGRLEVIDWSHVKVQFGMKADESSTASLNCSIAFS